MTIVPAYRKEKGIIKQVYPKTSDGAVNLSDGRKLTDLVEEIKQNKDSLDEINSTIESINVDEYSPVLTLNTSMGKIGKDDNINVSANVNDGFFKSAILKGQTLVNLNKTTYPITNWGTNVGNNNYYRDELTLVSGLIKPSTKYLFKIYGLVMPQDIKLAGTTTMFTAKSGNYQFNDNGALVVTSTETILDYTRFTPHFQRRDVKNLTEKEMNDFKMIIIEYVEGMENWDIPYFEGMQSVKMPVLTACGKNIFIEDILTSEKKKDESGRYIAEGSVASPGNSFVIKDIFKENTMYSFTCSCETSGSWSNVAIIYKDHQYNTYKSIANTNGVSVTSAKDKSIDYITIYGNKTSYIFDIQLEAGDPTTYEPFKSNILSTPQDLELRGIGDDVQDTLDLMTGEVTERIGEIVLDGSEEWALQTNSTDVRGAIYRLSITDIDPTILNFASNCLCNNAKTDNWGNIINTNTNKTFAVLQNQQLRVQFDGTLEELKMWLSETQPTIQYLKQKSIKTVPLSSVPLGFKDGHIMLSSGAEDYSLIPTLEYSVPTSISSQITQNSSVAVKHSKQIYSLEMLLMTSSIEDAYQRLLLQNDVELTRSISDNLEPNPLRHVMLSKIIEEKLYDELDMLDKLDIFLLYNEITLEQYIELTDLILVVDTEILE